MHTSEKAIWFSFLAGDKNAFGVIFKLYYGILYNYGLKISNKPHLTKDCLQDFFVYLYMHRKNIGEVQSIKSYLFVAFKRAMFKAIKKENRFITSNIEERIMSNFEFSPEEIAVKQEISEIQSTTITEILNSLSPREREAIYLKYYSELKISEVADIMNISYQSVLNTIQKAFKKIRNATENKIISKILENN